MADQQGMIEPFEPRSVRANGSGRVMSALLGALVIASVENGMGLLGLPAGVKFVVTGLVLLAAVLVDAISRRGRAQA